jgi:AcrR family transcriptional regulator
MKDSAKRAKTEAYRRLLLESAEQVFAEHGFDAAKIQDIAQGAGLSLGTLYTVFPGKTEIYTAIQVARGAEVLREIQAAMEEHEGVLERALRGIAAYVQALVGRRHYLRMHLREGLSWTERSFLRTGPEVATWELGIALAVGLLRQGIERGFLHADDPPELLLKMLIASHQAQLQDWLDRGADPAEIDALIQRMQAYFRRAFVRAPEPAAALGGTGGLRAAHR